tara:strand:+ start:112 stop:684 length:573 start_codon:yes stop_codon:yes gene_type:complete
MVNYESVIFDDEPIASEAVKYEPREEVVEEDIPVKPKKKLSQKQLEALAKGRARVAENRKNKLAELKKDKKFVEEGIKLIKEQKEKKKNIMRTQKEQAHYDKLMAKKLEKAQLETKEDEPLPPPPEADEPTDEFKIENFYSLREEFLGKCETLEDFEEMSGHLDTITDDDIVDDEKLLNKLNNILVNYNE